MRSYHMQPGTARFMVLASQDDRQKALRRGWVKVRRDTLNKVLPSAYVRKLQYEAEPGDIYAFRRGETQFGEDPTAMYFWYTGEHLRYLRVVRPAFRHTGHSMRASDVLTMQSISV